MIDIDTAVKLKTMRLSGMAECLEQISEPGGATTLSTVEVVRLMVDREWERRRNTKLARLRRKAGLPQPSADLSDIRAMPGRDIDTDLIARLAVGNYLLKHQNVILQGPTGAGKTFIACALANKACQQYKTVLYLRAEDLFDQITLADRAGTRGQLLENLVKVDLLIIDDWFLTGPNREQVQHLHALFDRRYQTGSTIFCTQLPPAKWHDRMEEKIVADAIIDRITTHTHTATLNCTESMRRHFDHDGDHQP
ncbi:MAG: ATP-binding protein [Micrococcales bacterium]|nr:ATP-binding protein [Micrococcales bacterium]